MQKAINTFLTYSPWYTHGVTTTNEKLSSWLNNDELYQKIIPAINLDIVGLFFEFYKLKLNLTKLTGIFIQDNAISYDMLKNLSVDVFKNRGDTKYCGVSLILTFVQNIKNRPFPKIFIPAIRINTIMKWNQKQYNGFDLITYPYVKDENDKWICNTQNPPRWNILGIAKFYEQLIDLDILELYFIKLQEELIEKI